MPEFSESERSRTPSSPRRKSKTNYQGAAGGNEDLAVTEGAVRELMVGENLDERASPKLQGNEECDDNPDEDASSPITSKNGGRKKHNNRRRYKQ
jgi:hypothetical protein